MASGNIGRIKAAKLERSERLQAVYKVLRNAEDWLTVRDIRERTLNRVEAVGAAIQELKSQTNCIKIDCEFREGYYKYRLRGKRLLF